MEKLKKGFIKFEGKIKMHKDRLLKPFFALMIKLGITPFLISMMALITGLVAAYHFAINNYGMFYFLIVLSIIFDILDGGLARFKGTQNEGFWIDFFFDRIVLLAMMIVVYFKRDSDSIIYILAPIIYVIETVIYAFIQHRVINITVRTPYLLIAVFSGFYSTILAIITDIMNLVGFLIYFIIKSIFKHESTDSSSRAK
ncbi:MAG: CDP-alcohol phosphatidyltransferase family protein [Patescibacteria group bacterium]